MMVKRALQWGIDNDHTRVIEGPTSRPGDNVVEINPTPTLRGTKTDDWNRRYIQTRTTNKLLNTAKQKAATETDPIIKPLHEATGGSGRDVTLSVAISGGYPECHRGSPERWHKHHRRDCSLRHRRRDFSSSAV